MSDEGFESHSVSVLLFILLCSDFGQYFTFWDHVFGTHKDPLCQWPYELDEAAIEQTRLKEIEEHKRKRHAAVSPAAAGESEAEEFKAFGLDSNGHKKKQ